MFGIVEAPFYFLVLTAIIAALTDLFWGKIVNALTIPSMLLAIMIHLNQGGLSAVGLALAGMICAFLIYGWIYAIGHLGAGDVKLLMAFGAWGGPLYCIEVALIGVIFGGVLATVSLLWHGRALQFLIRCRELVHTALWRLSPTENLQFDRSLKIPLGVALGASALSVLWGWHPLKEVFEHLGWGRWIWP